jgi:hypothetical protein
MALLASSYGAVNGLSCQHGRRMYVVDTVDGREYALDLNGTPRAIAIGPPMIEQSRRLIAQHLSELASTSSYQR